MFSRVSAISGPLNFFNARLIWVYLASWGNPTLSATSLSMSPNMSVSLPNEVLNVALPPPVCLTWLRIANLNWFMIVNTSLSTIFSWSSVWGLSNTTPSIPWFSWSCTSTSRNAGFIARRTLLRIFSLIGSLKWSLMCAIVSVRACLTSGRKSFFTEVRLTVTMSPFVNPRSPAEFGSARYSSRAWSSSSTSTSLNPFESMTDVDANFHVCSTSFVSRWMPSTVVTCGVFVTIFLLERSSCNCLTLLWSGSSPVSPGNIRRNAM